jgi:molecular chaperone DnaK
MNRDYIPIGIDHGTTNSALAIMDGDRPRIVKYNGSDEIMPSAVYITRHGRTLVGGPAIQAMTSSADNEGNGFTGYKLRMGQDDRYDFTASRRVLTPPQMGAVVIGELLGAYRKERDDDPKVCVITVPAKFAQAACDATREAAKLAGLVYYPLLMEPIAAALAYGFDRADKRAHWLVFDLGGGTLDVSLVIVRDGRPVIAEEGHAGDNYLGGRKFDRELFDHVREQLGKRYSLARFSPHNKDYATAWARLMLAVEQAKIVLSKKTEAVVEVDGVLCRDDAGREVKVEVPVTREAYQKMIAVDIEKAVHICRTLIAANGLTPAEVDRMILVGGPTKTPYIQETLRERLGINLDASIDPMTAVVQGAALYATSLVLPPEIERLLGTSEVVAGNVKLALEYEPRSNSSSYSIVGRVDAPDVQHLTVEVQRTDGLWSSGRVCVGEDGVFTTDVMLIDRGAPCRSTFTTSVLDQRGQRLLSVDEPKIWYPFPDVVPRLANSLAVAVKGNQVEVLINAGVELEAKGRGRFRTLIPVQRGSTEDVLDIAVLEGVTHLFGGEDSSADGHFHVGSLQIRGSDQRLSSDLPIGTEVEVTLIQDPSREIRARAYVPLLDEEFEATFKPQAFAVDLQAIKERLASLQRSLDEVRAIQCDKPLREVSERLETVERLQVLEGIGTDLDRAKEEPEAGYRAQKRTLELAGSVRDLQRRQQRVRLERGVESLRPVVEREELTELEGIEATLAQCTQDRLEHIEQALGELEFKVRSRPYCDLLIDLQALEGLRVSTEQHRLFTKANELTDRIQENGGVRNASEADLREMRQLHEDLMQTHDDLAERRRRVIEELGPGDSRDSKLRIHLESA